MNEVAVITENQLQMYQAEQFEVEETERGYKISSPVMCGRFAELIRSNKDDRGEDLCDMDFGKVGKAKKPSLLKSGAEKIANAAGMLQHYTLVSSIEHLPTSDNDFPFFMYTMKCELVKVNPADGKEYVFYSAYGSANSNESNNGKAAKYDVANKVLKIAQKRAFVSAVVSMGGLSDMFTMDIEDDNNGAQYRQMARTANKEGPITKEQIQRLWAKIKKAGYGEEEARKVLTEHGLPEKTSEIKQGDYIYACKLFEV